MSEATDSLDHRASRGCRIGLEAGTIDTDGPVADPKGESRTMIRTLRVHPVELMRQPGLTKEVRAELNANDLDIDDERLDGTVRVDLDATSSVDGVVVGGDLTVPWTAACRRCAAPAGGIASARVDELYQYDVTDDEAYAIEDGLIDLAPVVRQYTLLELPTDALCRPDCAGLCATCGIDRNSESCECEHAQRDPRWAALDGLVLHEPAAEKPDDTPSES